MTDSKPLLEVIDLSISFSAGGTPVRAVQNVHWSLREGETLAVLGESGSGKSVSTSAVLGLVDAPPAVFESGQILYRGIDLLKIDARQRRATNGSKISMIFQDPLAALNPVYSVGWQIAETMRIHGMPSEQVDRRVVALLQRVGIDDPEVRRHSYPHQFSGGQRQRIMIAAAIAMQPDLLIADEPTSALDVTVQAQVLDLLKEIQAENRMGMVIITHDLSIVSRVADHVVVMQGGRVVEAGPVRTVLDQPQHPYTRKLLDAVPGRYGYAEPHRLTGRVDKPLVAVTDVTRVYGGSTGVRAVDKVSFDLVPGETLGIIGESGSGKSTLARMLLGLDKPTAGRILIGGQDVSDMTRKQEFELRRRMQFVFQDPTASLNPRMTVLQIVSEPWAIHSGVCPRSEWRTAAASLMETVGLSADQLDRFPHEFSGGQRQRIAIARALALKPELIICDEAVSALDASVRAQVMDLLRDLRTQFGLSYIFIAHDLGLVLDFATSVMVMLKGQVVEHGPVDDVLRRPTHQYTKQLLAASSCEPRVAPV
jgi:peptide/nickel transport system ATP-binding protein